jgi:cell wall-associated NlpC family hydrolase
MAQQASINGLALGVATAGGLLVYAGLRGENPLAALRSVLTGSPAPVQATPPVTVPWGPGDWGGGSFAPGTASGAGVGSLPQLYNAAAKYLGVPYRWGGTDPRTGLDCSGLVVVAFRDIGITGVPRTSWGQRNWSKVRVVKDPGAGDLVWWPGHIGIMRDATTMINAPHTGTVVRIASVGPRNGVTPTYLRYTGGPIAPQYTPKPAGP